MLRKPMIIGIISDTHGLLRPEALARLQGSDLILHAGDIGSPDVLRTLKKICPVKAIRGNNDDEPWAEKLPETALVKTAEGKIFLEIRGEKWKPSLITLELRAP
jgi:putative phosphoesterase